jgi:hypothetical protein
MSVTDRFIAELAPVASGQVPKDSDSKYENLVKGLKHIQIKVSALLSPFERTLSFKQRCGRTKRLSRAQSS